MWEVRLHPEVEAWFLDLCRSDPITSDLVAEAIDISSNKDLPSAARWWID